MAKKKRSPASSEQAQIPELADEKHPAIDAAARDLYQERSDRIAAGGREKIAEQRLIALMQSEGMEHYKYEDMEVFADQKWKAKVKINGAQGGEEDEE